MSSEVARFEDAIDGRILFTRYAGPVDPKSSFRERLQISLPNPTGSISCEQALELAEAIRTMFPVNKQFGLDPNS